MSFSQRLQEIRDGFEPAFWVANVSEIFERLAYYGAFSSLANYLHESLNFPTRQTGVLTGIFGGMVWFLAILGGAVADRLGFRRALSIAYLILGCAYFLLGSLGAPWMAGIRAAVPLGVLVAVVLTARYPAHLRQREAKAAADPPEFQFPAQIHQVHTQGPLRP